MPTKYLAVTIAGAVSLGSYEAGATYEILDAVRQHNDNPETIVNGDFIRIDVLTGASAGGMTATILAQKLLFQRDVFVGVYYNPLYDAWVRQINLEGLLSSVDKPISEGGDPAPLSLFSSQLIEQIAQNILAQQDASGHVPLNGGMHNAIDPTRGIRLGLALTNINGVNYGYQVFGGDEFRYTNFSDQLLRAFGPGDRSFPPWKEISEAAVACGAFPFAFRSKALLRSRADFGPTDTLDPWPANAQRHIFAYTDGGVLQNQPLGMAKNLVDLNDNHLCNENRFYLFVSPSPMEGIQDLDLTEQNTNFLRIGKRLIELCRGQSVFRDWIDAQELNLQIDLLDARAAELAAALQRHLIDVPSLTETSQRIVDLLYSTSSSAETQTQAFSRLALQYAVEVGSLGGFGTAEAKAFLLSILTFEKSANLGERDRMQIYGIITEKDNLAGAGLSAFVGFFDLAFREHDYDWGRTVAQKLLRNPKFSAPNQLGPIRYTPASIRPINTSLDGIRLNAIPRSDVQTLKNGLKKRVNQNIADSFSNPLIRYPTQVGVDFVVGLLIDCEFSRNSQG
jgi:predicted acylesterase/phospholipase RssA